MPLRHCGAIRRLMTVPLVLPRVFGPDSIRNSSDGSPKPLVNGNIDDTGGSDLQPVAYEAKTIASQCPSRTHLPERSEGPTPFPETTGRPMNYLPWFEVNGPPLCSKIVCCALGFCNRNPEAEGNILYSFEIAFRKADKATGSSPPELGDQLWSLWNMADHPTQSPPRLKIYIDAVTEDLRNGRKSGPSNFPREAQRDAGLESRDENITTALGREAPNQRAPLWAEPHGYVLHDFGEHKQLRPVSVGTGRGHFYQASQGNILKECSPRVGPLACGYLPVAKEIAMANVLYQLTFGSEGSLGKSSSDSREERLGLVDLKAKFFQHAHVYSWLMEATDEVVPPYEVGTIFKTAADYSEPVEEAKGHERQRSAHLRTAECDSAFCASDHHWREHLLRISADPRSLRYTEGIVYAGPEGLAIQMGHIIRCVRKIATDPSADPVQTPGQHVIKQVPGGHPIGIKPLLLRDQWPQLLTDQVPWGESIIGKQGQNPCLPAILWHPNDPRRKLLRIRHLDLILQNQLVQDGLHATLSPWRWLVATFTCGQVNNGLIKGEFAYEVSCIVHHLLQSATFRHRSHESGCRLRGSKVYLCRESVLALSCKFVGESVYVVRHPFVIYGWFVDGAIRPSGIHPNPLVHSLGSDLLPRLGHQTAQTSKLRVLGGVTDVALQPLLEHQGYLWHKVQRPTQYGFRSILVSERLKSLHDSLDGCTQHPFCKQFGWNDIPIAFGVHRGQCDRDRGPDSSPVRHMFHTRRGRSWYHGDPGTNPTNTRGNRPRGNIGG
uniref:Uncharacterized protein n=1 Tax=Linepithema humile narna-like virus 1 TaxID=2259777 RepID=A0A2Z4Z3X0_9VIRU|nr:hypothetical protein [Linepithema humile narna-like virus 1]